MAFEDLKQRVLDEIDRNADHLIENVGEVIYRDPELGFKEFRTARVSNMLIRDKDLSHVDFQHMTATA